MKSSQLATTSDHDVPCDWLLIEGSTPAERTAKANSPSEMWPSSERTRQWTTKTPRRLAGSGWSTRADSLVGAGSSTFAPPSKNESGVRLTIAITAKSSAPKTRGPTRNITRSPWQRRGHDTIVGC